MSELDLKLVNGRLGTSAGVRCVDIGIRDGRIAAIGEWGMLRDAEEILEALPEIHRAGRVPLWWTSFSSIGTHRSGT